VRTTRLSPRQKKILELLAEGLNQKEISKILAISPNTVKAHLLITYERLGAVNDVNAVAISIRRKYIE